MHSFASLCLLALFASSDGSKMGPLGTILLDSIETCPDIVADEVHLSTNLQSIDSDTKALFANISTNIAIDDTITYKMDIRKWDSGWKPEFVHSGTLCPDINQYAPNLWKNFKLSTRPEISDKCSLEPGDYTIEMFQSKTKDFDIPSIFYGMMRVKIVAMKGHKEIACIVIEGNSQAPK
ncbi:hypothetical protein RI129_008485 [Pyrocoelia pectoralis]|uniref:MD-2-related lipid-recognition domain-containing protein n=1 Tax=Pyrocoelia pectoralis TaxID=417401 RepID=A0AAN7VBB6_9COLE